MDLLRGGQHLHVGDGILLLHQNHPLPTLQAHHPPSHRLRPEGGLPGRRGPGRRSAWW